jgi:hypothetical protein
MPPARRRLDVDSRVMSTFMGIAWIDLVPGADSGAAVAAFDARVRATPQQPEGFALEAGALPVRIADDRYRLVAWSDGNYGQLADVVVRLAGDTGMVSHAFIALDHDEYGAEHIVVDVSGGAARRAYHYFAYPRFEETGGYYTEAWPTIKHVPGIEEPPSTDDPGVLVDGPAARAAVAARYGVSLAAVDQAATADAAAHREIGSIGGPCSRWCDALGLAWPDESLAPDPAS